VGDYGTYIGATNQNVYRWQIALSDSIPEAGENSGSNFAIQNFDDTGAVLGTPLYIDRASGAITTGAINTGAIISDGPISFSFYYATTHAFGWDGTGLRTWVDNADKGYIYVSDDPGVPALAAALPQIIIDLQNSIAQLQNEIASLRTRPKATC
jgi:hypothetical protein